MAAIYLFHKNETRPLHRQPVYVLASVFLVIADVALVLSSCRVQTFANLKNHKWATVVLLATSGYLNFEWAAYTFWFLKSPPQHPHTNIVQLQSAQDVKTREVQERPLPHEINQLLARALTVIEKGSNKEPDKFLCATLTVEGFTSLHEVFSLVDWHHLPKNFLEVRGQPCEYLLDQFVNRTPVRHYTHNGFKIPNEFLRSCQILNHQILLKGKTELQGATQMIVSMILAISAELATLPVYNKQPSYRQAYFSPQFIHEHFQHGMVFEERGFFSTTKIHPNENKHKYGAKDAKKGDKKVLFTVQGSRGRDLIGKTSSPEEQEVLFLPYTSFTVLNKIDRGTHFEITLQEIVK